jgi:hypothetical protein
VGLYELEGRHVAEGRAGEAATTEREEQGPNDGVMLRPLSQTRLAGELERTSPFPLLDDHFQR